MQKKSLKRRRGLWDFGFRVQDLGFRVFFQYEFEYVQFEAVMPECAVGDVSEIVGQL